MKQRLGSDTRAALGPRAVILGAAIACLLAGCGDQSTSTPTPSASTGPAVQPPRVMTVDDANGQGNNAGSQLHVYDMSASEQTKTDVTDVDVVGYAQTSGGVFATSVSQAQLYFYGPDGKQQSVAAIKGQFGGAIASPDGTQWLWTEWDPPADPTQTAVPTPTRFWLGGPGKKPSLLHTETLQSVLFFSPVKWTKTGVVVETTPTGLGCGFCPYGLPFGASMVDLTSGDLTALTDATCGFQDIDDAGDIACTLLPVKGVTPKPTLRIISAAGQPQDFHFPATVEQVGSAHFIDDHTVGVGWATSTPKPSGGIFQIDLTSSQEAAFGPPGAAPQIWLADGRILALDLTSTASDASLLIQTTGKSTAFTSGQRLIALIPGSS